MKPSNRCCFWIAIAASALLPAFAACSGDTKADATSPPTGQTSNDPNVFEVNHPEQFPLVAVETRAAADRLNVNGVVAPDVSLTVHVTSLSGGRVVDIRARLGDEVKKGQVLVVIRSQDLAMAISDYQKFIADELLARKALDRARLLYEHGAIAQKDLETAQDAEDKAKVDVAAGAERIRILGGDIDHLSPVIEVKSPVSGAIVEQNTAGGEGVKSLDNSPNLFTIADLSRVWVLCDVYENNLAQVHLGDGVEVRLNAYPEKVFKGRIGNISQLLDPNTRAAKVRVELANGGGIFRPGMFAVAQFTSRGNVKRMALPATALLRLHDKDWVFRHEGDRRYRRVEIQAGVQLADGYHTVLSGIQPGDKLVANALQFSAAMEQK
jgi:cobalt-zinc-cadmium efflux system membrane fusion protein